MDSFRNTSHLRDVSAPKSVIHSNIPENVLERNHQVHGIMKSNTKTKGVVEMDNTNWQEKYFDSLDENIKEIKQGFTNTENRISEMVNKHIDYSTHLDKQRHEENLILNKKMDDSINTITSQLDSTNKWIIALAVSTIISVGALVVTAISAIK